MKLRRPDARRFWVHTFLAAGSKPMANSNSNFVLGFYLELLFDEFAIQSLDESQEIQGAFDEASQQVKIDCL